LFTGNKWGTSNPIMMRDKDFGVIRLRAFGTYDFRITNAALFLKEVAGTDQNFRIDEFADTMRSRIVSIFSEALAKAQVPALDVAQRYSELGDALLQLINPAVSDKYGLEITSFLLENVSVPPEVEQAIDKRSSMGAIGNLNDYVKYQMGQAMANGGEGAAAATIPATMAMGFGMAQEMMKGMQGGAAGAHGLPEQALLLQTLSRLQLHRRRTPRLHPHQRPCRSDPGPGRPGTGRGRSRCTGRNPGRHLKARQIGSQWRIGQAHSMSSCAGKSTPSQRLGRVPQPSAAH
jgi:hypothetical protein